MADGDDDVPLILTWDEDTSGLLTDDASERPDESKSHSVISFDFGSPCIPSTSNGPYKAFKLAMPLQFGFDLGLTSLCF